MSLQRSLWRHIIDANRATMQISRQILRCFFIFFLVKLGELPHRILSAFKTKQKYVKTRARHVQKIREPTAKERDSERERERDRYTTRVKTEIKSISSVCLSSILSWRTEHVVCVSAHVETCRAAAGISGWKKVEKELKFCIKRGGWSGQAGAANARLKKKHYWQAKKIEINLLHTTTATKTKSDVQGQSGNEKLLINSRAKVSGRYFYNNNENIYIVYFCFFSR